MIAARDGKRRLGVVVAGLVLAGALAVATIAPSVATQAATQAAASPRGTGPAEGVDARIAALHKQLAITPAQEPAFQSYAEIMRDNARAMAAMFADRAAHPDYTAPGILHWHAELTTAHADGLNKLLPAFDALYGALTDPQKQAADAAFEPLRVRRAPRKAG